MTPAPETTRPNDNGTAPTSVPIAAARWGLAVSLFCALAVMVGAVVWSATAPVRPPIRVVESPETPDNGTVFAPGEVVRFSRHWCIRRAAIGSASRYLATPPMLPPKSSVPHRHIVDSEVGVVPAAPGCVRDHLQYRLPVDVPPGRYVLHVEGTFLVPTAFGLFERSVAVDLSRVRITVRNPPPEP